MSDIRRAIWDFVPRCEQEEKDKAYEILFAIDASQSNTWEKIKK